MCVCVLWWWHVKEAERVKEIGRRKRESVCACSGGGVLGRENVCVCALVVVCWRSRESERECVCVSEGK